MGQAPIRVVMAVSIMGRKRTAPASEMALRSGSPRATFSSINSISTMALRITMPPSAIMPIIPVAVKKMGLE